MVCSLRETNGAPSCEPAKGALRQAPQLTLSPLVQTTHVLTRLGLSTQPHPASLPFARGTHRTASWAAIGVILWRQGASRKLARCALTNAPGAMIPIRRSTAARNTVRLMLTHSGAVSWPLVRSLDSTMPISTRRLAVRACSLSPGTCGSALPKPLEVMIVEEIPAFTR